MTRLHVIVTLAVFSVCLGGRAAPAFAQTPARPESERRPAPIAPPSLFAQVSMSGVLDTNIDHEFAADESYGGVGAARVGVRWAGAAAEYRLGINRFSNTIRWNRTTHQFVGRFTAPLASRLTANLYGDTSLNHTTEDRELADYVTLQPQIEFRIDSSRRLRGRWRYRARQVQTDAGLNAARTDTGVEFEQRFGRNQRASVEFRLQREDSTNVRQRFAGHVWDAEYRANIGALNALRVQVEYRSLEYPERFLEDVAPGVLRADRRWARGVSWTRTLDPEIEWRLEYELEHRTSNELTKSFRAHRLGWTMIWLTGGPMTSPPRSAGRSVSAENPAADR